jgi:alkylhydroperoxidase family enzyme
LAGLYGQVAEVMGGVPALYRVLGNAPGMLDGWVHFAWALRHDATSDRALRELLILRVALVTGNDYEWRHHWDMALRAGATEDALRALPRWRDGATGFSNEENATLAMADELTETGRLGDAAWSRLRGIFDDRQSLELVLTAAFYACVSRVLHGLRIGLEDRYAHLPPVPDVG